MFFFVLHQFWGFDAYINWVFILNVSFISMRYYYSFFYQKVSVLVISVHQVKLK